MQYQYIHIQVLRAVAAIMVVALHASIKWGQYSGSDEELWFGGLGVDVFFIISGVLIAGMLGKKDLSPIVFMKKRAARVLPFYWVATALALIVYFVAPSQINRSGGVTSPFFSFILWPGEHKFLIQNGWTLTYEFMFYGLTAVALYLSDVRHRIALLFSLVFFVIFIGYIFDPLPRSSLGILTAPISLEFCFGVLWGLVLPRFVGRSWVAFLGIFFGGMVFLLLSEGLMKARGFDRAIICGLLSLAIVATASSLEPILKKMGEKNFIVSLLKRLGDASYGLYLLHSFVQGVVFLVVKKVMPNTGAELFFALMVLIPTLISIPVFLWIEKPLNAWVKSRYKI